MTTHWPTDPDAGVHLGAVEDCDECSRIVLPEPIETAMPWRGSCGLCGGPDARHRVLDALQDYVHGGTSVADLAELYDLPEPVVEYIAEHWVQDGETWTTATTGQNGPETATGRLRGHEGVSVDPREKRGAERRTEGETT